MAKKSLQPTYKRQQFLLSYICQINNGVTATDIQKLVFLSTMKEQYNFYDFVPYRFGPYSFQLAEDIEILCKHNYLYKDGSTIKAIGNYESNLLFNIPSERGDNLIKKAYYEYPYFAVNSEIINRLFNKKEIDYFKHKKQQYLKKDQILFTIGYEGKSIESFMNLLIINDVKLLCDVRKNPISRKFGFSKSRLKYIADRIGIDYVHIPNLGIASEKRISLNSIEDYNNLFYDYSKSLNELKPYLEKIYSLLCRDNRIAIMCYEKNPNICHRHLIKNYIVNTYKIRSIDL